MLTLSCLGGLRLEHGGVPRLAGRRKPLALLAFLARRGQRPSSREELAALLWSSSDEASARKSLRQCLSELRSVEGLAFTETEGGVFLTPETLATDAAAFEDDIRHARWESAVDRWRGDFLAGGDSLGDNVWQIWLDGERATLRRQLATACEQATAAAEQRGEWREVIRATERWRAVLPDDVRAWAREIHALQTSGRVAEAIARVAEAEHYFGRQLGERVPDEIARLSRVLARVGQVGSAAASLMSPDLVGRGEALSTLARARGQLRSSVEVVGRCLLLVAAEGRGKTRVLREFVRQIRDVDAAMTVIEGATLRAETSRPYSLLQGIVAALASQDALAGCAPETLATLAHVSPALREHFRHLPPVDSPAPAAIAAAFSRALAEVARESPVVLVLDDFPDADRESLVVMTPLIIKAPRRTLVVAAGRPESWYQSALTADLLNHAETANRLTLAPLRRNETRGVLSSMAPLAPATLETLTDALHMLSGGVPGLVTSLMTQRVSAGALVRGETGEWSLAAGAHDSGAVPTEIEERWQSRYGRMAPDAQQVVDALAVLGSGTDTKDVDVADLESVAQLDAARFRTAVDALRAAGILERSNGTIAFVAEAHRLVTYSGMSPSTRHRLHERAARRLRTSSRWPATRLAAEYHRRASRSAHNPRRSIAVAAIVMVAALVWLGVRRNSATVNPGATVLLADVTNLTGDSAFDEPLLLAASVGLQQSRQVSLFPRSRVRETLALMQRPGADSAFDEALAREVALRENLQRVIVLGVARVESVYVVTARIVHPASGRDLFADLERAPSRADVLDRLDRLLSRVRRASGESADSVRAYSLPLPRVTTSSLTALQAYAAGIHAWNTRRFQEAIDGFQRAVEVDSSFALAWLGLAEASYQLRGDRSAGDAALGQAQRFADRLTEREQLRLQQAALGYRGMDEEQLRIAELLALRFPERDTWYSVGTFRMRMRRCPEAIQALERSLTFDSSFASAQINIATCHQFLGASDSAVAAYGRAYAADTASVYSGGLNHEFGVALVRAGLVDSAQRVYSRMANRPRAFDRQFGQRSLGYLAGWLGRYSEAAAHFDSAAKLAIEMEIPLTEFRNRILQSEHLLTAGDSTLAAHALDAAWKLIPRLSLEPAFALYAGLAHVRAGRIERAAALLHRIAAAARPSSSDDRTVHAVLAARIALARGNALEARRALLAATDTTRSDYILAALADVSIALGHPDSALAAATRLSNRATFGTDAQDSWVRNLIRKAEIEEQLGRAPEARNDYRRLEAQWSGGDPYHPLRLEARRGITRLAGADARTELPVKPPNP